MVSGALSLSSLVVVAVLVPVMIRYLGPAEYGIWVLVGSFSLAGGYLSLGDLGLQQSLVKFVAEAEGADEHERLQQLVSSGLLAFTILGALATLVTGLFAFWAPTLLNVPAQLSDAVRILLLLVALEALVGFPGLVLAGVLEGVQRYGAFRAVELLRLAAFTGLILLAIELESSVVAFGVVTTFTALLSSVGFFVGVRTVAPQVRLTFRAANWSTIAELGRFGRWLFLNQVNGIVWRQMDKLILAAVISTSVLTTYDIANKIQAGAGAILSFTTSAVIPAAARLGSVGDHEAIADLFLRGTRYAIALSAPVAIGAMLLAEPLIGFWIGPGYEDAVGPTRLFLTYHLLVSVAGVILTGLVGLGYARTTTMYAALATLINVAVSLVLVGRYGVEGVIFATLVGYAITTPLFVRLGLRVTGTRSTTFLRKAVLPLVPWLLVFALGVHLLARAVPPPNLIAVIAWCVPPFAVYAAGVLLVATPSGERRRLIAYLRREISS